MSHVPYYHPVTPPQRSPRPPSVRAALNSAPNVAGGVPPVGGLVYPDKVVTWGGVPVRNFVDVHQKPKTGTAWEIQQVALEVFPAVVSAGTTSIPVSFVVDGRVVAVLEGLYRPSASTTGSRIVTQDFTNPIPVWDGSQIQFRIDTVVTTDSPLLQYTVDGFYSFQLAYL